MKSYPEGTHIIHVGRQYLGQVQAVSRLISRYEEINDDNIILAGNVWGVFEDSLIPRYRTYDHWAFPDLEGWEYKVRPPTDLLQVSSVGLPLIYPVSAWKKYPFHNPSDMADGIWYNEFCRETELPVFCDLSTRFYRTKHDSDIPYARIMERFGREIWNLRKNLYKHLGWNWIL